MRNINFGDFRFKQSNSKTKSLGNVLNKVINMGEHNLECEPTKEVEHNIKIITNFSISREIQSAREKRKEKKKKNDKMVNKDKAYRDSGLFFYQDQKIKNINIISILQYRKMQKNFDAQSRNSAILTLDHHCNLQHASVQQDDQSRDRRLTMTSPGLQQANLEKALKQKQTQSNLYLKGKRIQTNPDLSHFKMYGSGIYLFFCFLKQASVLFLIFTFLSIVPITINYVKGSAFSNSQSSLQYYFAKSSIGNYQYSNGTLSQQQSIGYKIANVVIDIITCFAFLVFFIYWEIKSAKIVKDINKNIKMLSSQTLQVEEFPQNVHQNDILQYMSRFGDVSEVAPVKNYSESISLSKKIYELRIEKKQLEMDIRLSENGNPTAMERIKQLTQQTEKLFNQFERVQVAKKKYLKFYVQFDKPEVRDQVMEKFIPYQKLCICCDSPPPSQMLLQGEMIKVNLCDTQPGGIIWQNVHITWKTRWMRYLLQFFIVLIVIIGGFLLIAFLNILVPQTAQNVDTSSYDWSKIKTETNKTIIEAWCNKNIEIYKASQYESVCLTHWKGYISAMAIKVAISIALIVLKAVIKIIMVFIAKFQRYTTYTEQSVGIMTNLLVTYLCTTVLITFLLQANVFKISFKSFISHLIQDKDLLDNLSKLTQYYDLGSSWYRDIGYQIWFNLFTLSFIPHIFMPFVFHLVECLNQWLAQKQRIYKKMYNRIRPTQFQIEDNYANILMVIMIGFIFGGGSPLMVVLTFIGLFSRLLYFKYIFIRFCRVPKTFNESLNNRALRILKVTLFIRCLISLYMYGANGVFAMQKSSFMKWSQSLDLPLFSQFFVVISRIFLTWYYTLFVILFVLVMVFKQIVISFLINICKREANEKIQENANDSAGQIMKNQTISQRALTKSYKLQKNPDYIEILAIMNFKQKKNNLARESILPMPIEKITND